MSTPRTQQLTGIDNARIVLSDRVVEGSIELDDGHITAVGPRPIRRIGRLDAHGGYLIPGLVDLHSDAIERQWQPRPSAEFEPALAFVETDRHFALAGITTAVDAVAFIDLDAGSRSIDRAQRQWNTIRQLRGNALIRHELHLRCEVTQPRSVAIAADALRRSEARLVSAMDHTPEEVIQASDGVSAAKTATEIRALAAQARQHGIRFASHDDPTEASVQAMADLGVDVFEFPVTIGAAKAVAELGLASVVGAPNLLRGRSHIDRLAAADAIAANLASAVCSDYAPAALLRAVFKLAATNICDLPAAVALASARPAAIVGLDDRGVIRPGALADLVLVHDHHGLPTATHTLVNGQLVMQAAPTRNPPSLQVSPL
ncbi:alpha-D-ribose 1-methylphosphonate 5-triphosphate diphosphatase [Nocardia sp. NPDC059239]|uniref:alpha-D-ribose 1-methylphosphonate 5-triphosphate diphosphatase n=1 Tax=Nocardia sp. NPDC059239 TaxID=3346785 RepID=UPI0036C69794